LSNGSSDAVESVRDFVRFLRIEMPTVKPVRVYFRTEDSMPDADEIPGTSLDGLCVSVSVRNREHYHSIFILIGTQREMLDTLKHEWAHALTWTRREVNAPEHCYRWGRAMTKVQLAFEKWVS